MFSKKLLGGAALSAISVLGTGVAYAQSTGSQVNEEAIVVTAGRRSINGAMSAETVSKSRATITQDLIEEQSSGQSFLQTINLVPGVNFTNNDSYGSSGGNLRIHGFDGNRISLTWDGMPLNDSGNYAIFSNQLADSEIIQRIAVNIGTTDLDSPTASATGGTVNVVTRLPEADMQFAFDGALGTDDFWRAAVGLDTGEIGPWDTTSFGTVSWQEYQKWRGRGELQKHQYNARFYQPLGGDDFISVAFHWNENRNNSYRSMAANTVRYYGWGYDNLPGCLRDAGNNGVVDNDNAVVVSTTASTTQANTSTFQQTGLYLATGDNPLNPSSCTNFYGLRINPSNTGNIRGQARFSLGENFILTVDPSFQYVLANGGGFATFSERDDRLDLNTTNNANPTAAQCASGTFNTGVDLNGDADTCDTVGVYAPSNTNTRRYGVLSSLIWNINDDQRMRLAYTIDFARHRQTGEYGLLSPLGVPLNVFGGKDGNGPPIVGLGAAGVLQARNRFSIASLHQVALEYSGYFFDSALQLTLGLRAPVFDRELNQKCYSLRGTSTVRCTNETPSATLANGNVQFASQGTSEYIPPYHAEFTFEDVLPNVGATWRIGDSQSVYASYAESLSAPRTDNLYTPNRLVAGPILFPGVDPETSQTIDVGYRYNSGPLMASVGIWHTDFQNRIVSAFDEELQANVDRNLGNVTMQGVDLSASYEIGDTFDIYASASIMSSEVQNNVPLGSPTKLLPTAGQELVETPDQTYTLRANWDPTPHLHFGIQGKFVGRRAATDINDEIAPSYQTWDMNARLEFKENTWLQVNVNNLFDEQYFGSISSGTNFTNFLDLDPVTPGNQGQAPNVAFYQQAAPRTVMVSVRTRF